MKDQPAIHIINPRKIFIRTTILLLLPPRPSTFVTATLLTILPSTSFSRYRLLDYSTSLLSVLSPVLIDQHHIPFSRTGVNLVNVLFYSTLYTLQLGLHEL